MAEVTAFDSSLGLFQGRVKPRFAATTDTNAITDLVGSGASTTVIPAQVGGFVADALVGRVLRIGNDERRIASNTPTIITVEVAFLAVPLENAGLTVKGGEFVWALGFDFRDRKEAFKFGDGIQVQNHAVLANIAFLTARVWIKQPKKMLDQRNLTLDAVIIPNASSNVTNLIPALPEIADAAATGSSFTVTNLTFGGLTVNAHIGRKFQVGEETRAIASNTANTVTVSPAFTTVAAPGQSVRIVERGPLITTEQPHYVAVGDSITVDNVVWTGLPALSNRPFPVRTIVSSTVFELDAPAFGAGAYTQGGNIGLRERFFFPEGLTEDDVGRYVQIAGSSNAGNNGSFRIVGLRQQPSLAPLIQQAWLQRADDNKTFQHAIGAGSTTTVIQSPFSTYTVNALTGFTMTIDGQERTVASNTSNTITVGAAFTPFPAVVSDGLTYDAASATPRTGRSYVVHSPVVYEAVAGGVTVVGKGARWRVSLLVQDGSANWVSCARAVQKPTEDGFFRADLKAYVKGITVDRGFAIKLDLIEHNVNDVYTY